MDIDLSKNKKNTSTTCQLLVNTHLNPKDSIKNITHLLRGAPPKRTFITSIPIFDTAHSYGKTYFFAYTQNKGTKEFDLMGWLDNGRMQALWKKRRRLNFIVS